MCERFDHCDDCEQVHAIGNACTQCPRTAVHDQLCATHYADEYGYTPAIP